MFCRHCSLLAMGLFVSWVACADDFADLPLTALSVASTPEKTYRAATPRQIAFPDDVATPIFWIDCADTRSWTITDGTNVLAIPAGVPNSSRKLTCDPNATDFNSYSWKGWGWPGLTSNLKWPKPPVLTSAAEGLAGHGVLDFGAIGSRRGLVFDLWSPDADTPASNVLARIGTVCAIYDSTESGGFFMGGGFRKNNSGYNWHRGACSVCYLAGSYDDETGHKYSTAEADQFRYSNPFVVNHAQNEIYSGGGHIRNWGLPGHSQYMGLTGNWAPVTLRPSAAVLEATGLGIADLRSKSDWSSRSGGMRIAEMIIFDTLLTEEQVLRVETYLRQKWFGAPRGWNGNARLGAIATDNATDRSAGNGVRVTLDVPADETASVTTLEGGHLDSAFVKTGDGTLDLGAAPNFATPIEMKGGTLALSRRTLPDNVPTNYFFRLDASRTELLVKDAQDYVSVVSNAEGRTFYGRPVHLGTPYAKPRYVADALGAGKPVLDLGKNVAFKEGAYLQFVTNRVESGAFTQINVPAIASVVAVVDAFNGGGTLLHCAQWNRAATASSHTVGLLEPDPVSSNGYPYHYPTGGVVFVDGVRRNPTEGYPTPGYHVVAMRVPVSDYNVIGIGAQSSSRAGGMRLAEVIVYDRMLTDAELRDAGAFLMDKWLGRVPGDYASRTPTAIADVQTVKFSAPGAIHVPAGETAHVGRLVLNAPVVKTGAGTLRVTEGQSADQMLTIAEGAVVTAPAPDVAAADELAQGAALHLDAADAALLETETVNGTNFVDRWFSKGFANFAYAPSYRPWLNAVETPNGLPTLDFGPGNVADAPFMVFGRALHAIRSVYMVWRPRNIDTFLLGTSGKAHNNGKDAYDFHRGTSSGILFRNSLFNEIYTNGVASSKYAVMPANEWRLVEVHADVAESGGLGASALAIDRGYSGSGSTGGAARTGGQSIGELIVFERRLSAREKVATRNYLLKKWFPDLPRADLPAAPEAKESAIYELPVAGTRTEAPAAGEEVSASRLVGEGVLTKDGAGALSVKDATSFTGTVEVLSGTFRLHGVPPAEGELVADGRIFHADATFGVTTHAAADGRLCVTEWKSRLEDGWTLAPLFDESDDVRPSLFETGLNGLPVVDMAVPTGTNNAQGLRFKRDGAWDTLPGICSVVWVFGSQNGGGLVLGGGTNISTRSEFLRDFSYGSAVSRPSDNILSTAAKDVARWGGYWYLNGEFKPYDAVPGTTRPMFGLSGGWDLLEWNSRSAASYRASADGFGFAGAILTSAERQYWQSVGQQRLAEVIIYDRPLTDAERDQNRAYLCRKWGIMDTRAAWANEMAVELAAGATFDCGGTNQYVKTLTGAGTVANGTLTAGRLVCDAQATAWPEVTGAFAVTPGLEIVLQNLDAVRPLKGKVFPVLDVAAVVDADNLGGVVFTGEPVGYKARATVADGRLVVSLFSSGTALIFR